jgi:hypothetical protein
LVEIGDEQVFVKIAATRRYRAPFFARFFRFDGPVLSWIVASPLRSPQAAHRQSVCLKRGRDGRLATIAECGKEPVRRIFPRGQPAMPHLRTGRKETRRCASCQDCARRHCATEGTLGPGFDRSAANARLISGWAFSSVRERLRLLRFCAFAQFAPFAPFALLRRLLGQHLPETRRQARFAARNSSNRMPHLLKKCQLFWLSGQSFRGPRRCVDNQPLVKNLFSASGIDYDSLALPTLTQTALCFNPAKRVGHRDRGYAARGG